MSISPAVRVALAVAALTGASTGTWTGVPRGHAQDYPSRPLHLILPYNPGGIVDYVGRTMAQGLAQASGQSVVAENKPGAGGIIGTRAVATSDPDGHTLLVMDPAIVINPLIQTETGYDLFRDLSVVSVVSSSSLVLVTTPSLPVASLPDLVDYAKAHPGTLNYASAGVGTTPHLAGELLRLRTGTDLTHVPYRGIASSFADLMTAKVQFSFSGIPGAKPLTDDHRLRALATTRTQRSSAYPDLPTVIEAGLPGFDVDVWIAVFAPAATPGAAVERLNALLRQSLGDPVARAALAKVGVEARLTTPADGTAFVRADYEKWKQVVETAHLKQ